MPKKNTQGWIQRFTLLEQNIPKPTPALLPVLLQGQKATLRMGEDKFRPSLQRHKTLLLQEGAGGRRDKESECLGCHFPSDRDLTLLHPCSPAPALCASLTLCNCFPNLWLRVKPPPGFKEEPKINSEHTSGLITHVLLSLPLAPGQAKAFPSTPQRHSPAAGMSLRALQAQTRIAGTTQSSPNTEHLPPSCHPHSPIS